MNFYISITCVTHPWLCVLTLLLTHRVSAAVPNCLSMFNDGIRRIWVVGGLPWVRVFHPYGLISCFREKQKGMFYSSPSTPAGTCPQCQVPLHFPSLHVSGSQCVGPPQTHQQWNLVSQAQERAGVAASLNRVERSFAHDTRAPRNHHYCWSHCPIIPSYLELLSTHLSH